MNYINPLKLDIAGHFSQFQSGDWLAMKYGGVGPKTRGSVLPQSGTTVIPFDNTPPLVTEGTQLWSLTVTPLGIDSYFNIIFDTEIDVSGRDKNVTISIFRGSTLIGLRTTSASGYSGVSPTCMSINLYDYPNTTSSVTYSCRIGIDSGTWYLGQGNAQTMGGNNPSWWSVKEEL